MAAVSTSVTESDVRTALNNISADHIAAETVSAAIDYGEMYVGFLLPADHDAPTEHIEEAVTQIAARKSFNSVPRETRARALDSGAEWDVKTFVQELKARERETLELLSVHADGFGGAFARTTRSVSDMDISGPRFDR